MTDADGDGTWEAVASVIAGSGPNYYAFFNSPSTAWDWGTKEVLTGQPCGISSNYDDRVLPTITSDTTIQHCFGSCETDGTCPVPPSTSNVTFSVDMNTYAGSQTPPYTVNINGTFNGWNGTSDPMSDADGDGVWDITLSLTSGTSIEYKFTVNGWSDQENFAGGEPCTVTNGGFTNRFLAVPSSDSTLGTVCFNSCSACPTPSPISNVTFSVDMNTYAGSQTAPYTVYINGTFNGWNGTSDPMSDADGDGVWDVTLPLNSGDSIRYKFTVNGWNDQENFAGGEPCTNTNSAGFTDRVLTVPSSDSTLGTVCFNSCSACPPPPGCYYVIDMQDSWGDGWNGASVTVSVNGAAVATWGLSSGSSGTDSLETLNGDVVDFSFTSGSYDSEITFQITDPAGNNIYNGGAPSAGSFLNHTSNSSCVPQTVNVTFQVDMGLVAAGTFTTPEVNGTWNNWCGNCNPMTDADGDGIWEATIPLLSGTYEYKYSADAWTIQEMNDPTAPCTNGNATYTNRTLSVGTSDITLSVVCWGSCDPCLYPPQAPTGVTCSVGNPSFVFTDDLEATAGWTGVATSGNGTWRIDGGGTGSSNTGPSAAYSGSNYFYFEASSGGASTAELVSPAVDISAGVGAAELTFWMHAYGSGINTLDVGVSTSATGPFTNLYTWSGQYQTDELDPWYQVGVDLTSYVGQTVYVAFTYTRGTAGVGYEADLAIDYVQVASCLTCAVPSALMASNVTTNSADVSWTASGTETEWLMVVNGASSVVTSTTQALTGLMSNTQYDVQVAAICGAGDTSGLSPTMSFTTLCDVEMAPYLENFDSGLSSCWTQETTDDFDWTIDAFGTPSSTTGPSDDVTGGGNYLYIETSSPRTTGDSALVHTNNIDISSLTNPQLRFYSHMYGASIRELSVWITDASGSLSQIFIKNGDQGNQWNEELISLSNYSGILSFTVLAVVSDNGSGTSYWGDIAIDNFEVRETPTCADPSGLTLGTVTTDSIGLSWTPGGNETQWLVYLVDASGSLSTTTPTSVNSNSAILAVNSSTAYSAYVQSVCPAGDSSIIVGPQSFITPCNFNVVEIAPYLENFDNGLNCWTQETTDDFDWTIDAFGTPSSPTGPSDDLTGGGNYLYIETSSPRTTGDSALVHTNNIDISSLTNPQLRFYSHMYGLSIGELSVWITDASGTLSQVFIKTGDQGNQWNEELISLSNYSGIVSFTVLAVVSDDGAGTSIGEISQLTTLR